MMNNSPFPPNIQQMLMQRLNVGPEQLNAMMSTIQQTIQQSGMSPQQYAEQLMANGKMTQDQYNFGRTMANNITGLNY